MKISIIVPVYNSEKHIDRCIKSILRQSYENWELILINDGSIDKSPTICNKYSQLDSRIKVINKLNEGVSKARNIGIKHATGDWITFCDSDDEMLPDALKSYIIHMEVDIDIIRAGFVRIKKGKSTIISTPTIISNNKEEIIIKCSTSNYEAYLWNSCFRASIIKNIQFNEFISWCEDHLFTFSAIKYANKVAFISNIVYRYYAPAVANGTFGDNLSTCYIDPDMILMEAEEEYRIKLSYLEPLSTIAQELLKHDFNYKIDLAIKYAILGNHYLKAYTILHRYRNNIFGLFLKNIYYYKISKTISKWKKLKLL